MLRKLLAVAMVATLMLGGAAWAGALVENLSLSPNDYTASDVAVDGTIVTGMAIHSSAPNSYTIANPYVIRSVTLGASANSQLNVGYQSLGGGAALSANPVAVRVGTLNFTEATSNVVRVSSQGYLEVTNAVTVAGSGNRIALRGGTIAFMDGAEIATSLGLRTNGGEILAGEGSEVLLSAGRAVRIDTTGNLSASEGVVDASTVDFVVDFTPGAGAFGAIEWIPGAANNANELATLNVNKFTINEGFVILGRQNTAFAASDLVIVGGNPMLDATNKQIGYEAAQIRFENGGGAVAWTGGVDADGKSLGAAYIGPGGNIYTVDVTTAGDDAIIKAGTTGVAGSADINIRGSDMIYAGGPVTDFGGFLPFDIPVPTGMVSIDASSGAPLVFDNQLFDSTTGTGTYAKMNVSGSLVGFFGEVDASEYDMTVSLQGDEGGLIDNLVKNGTIANFTLGGTPVDVTDFIEAYSVPALVTEKFSGIALVGNPLGGGNSVLTVNKYNQTMGTVISTANGKIEMQDDALITGGIFASNADIYADMDYQGTSFNLVDRAVLLGGGQEIWGRGDVDDNWLTIGQYGSMNTTIGDIKLIDVDSTLIEYEGDIVFGGQEEDVLVTLSGGAKTSAEFIVENTGSIEFSETFMKGVAADPAGFQAYITGNPFVLVQAGAAGVTLDIPDLAFDGLLGAYTVELTKDAANLDIYAITGYSNDVNLDWDGSAPDVAKADSKLNQMYGNKTNGGLNAMIYKSYSENFDPTNPYERLYLINGGSATAGEINSFNMNMENLQHFANGRSEANSVFNLYNGNAMNGVNMVSQAVARSHIRTAMNRSDEIRETWNMVKNTVSGGDGLASSIMNSCYTNRVWVGGFGLWEDADSNDGLAGYKYKSGGFIVGYDRLIGQSWIVGGSFAYNKGDFEDKAAIGHDSDIDNYSFNLYATYTHCSGFFGTAFAGYTYSDNDISETYLTDLNKRVRSNHDNHTNTWVVGGKVGYDWKPNERFYITPSIGFTYINARTSAHQAMLGGNQMGRFSKLKDEAAYIPVELNIGYDVYVCEDSKLNLNLNLGYAYNFDEDGVSGDIALNGFGNGLSYGVQSREQGHHLFNVGAGATFSKGRFDFGVKYDYYRQEDADTHRVLGTVGFKF